MKPDPKIAQISHKIQPEWKDDFAKIITLAAGCGGARNAKSPKIKELKMTGFEEVN